MDIDDDGDDDPLDPLHVEAMEAFDGVGGKKREHLTFEESKHYRHLLDSNLKCFNGGIPVP